MSYPDLDPLNWSTVQPEVDRLLATNLTPEVVASWLQQWSDLAAVLQESAAAISRAVAENTADQEAEARFLRYVEEILPQETLAAQALRDKLLAVPGYDPASSEIHGLLQRFGAEARIFRLENVSLETELAKLANRYDKIVGTMDISWNGSTETMPQAQVHLFDASRPTRERAWRLMMNRWQADRAGLNDLYLEMLAIRRREAHNAGLADYRAYQWLARHRFDYTPKDCFTLHDAIEAEVVPLAGEFYRELGARMGLDGLRPWDSEIDPSGPPLKPFEDVADLESGVQRIFAQLDPALAGHFRLMREGWLDLASRPNKAPGGFCSTFPASRRPYIFMSAVGTHNDVATLLHEGGHACHYLESAWQPLLWNTSGPLEFCEVASMGMELLAAPYLGRDRGGFYAEAEARRAYADQLRRIVFFLPYMAIVDAFQHWVYTQASHDAGADAFDAKWSELCDRFMPGLDWRGLQAEKESGWHRKLHIFQIPFYYIEYGLAQLGALQVWRNALQDQARAVADYRAALSLGYTRSLPELYRAAGATFRFDREMVGGLMSTVREQLAALDA